MTKLSKGVNKMELKNGDVSLSVGHVLAQVLGLRLLPPGVGGARGGLAPAASIISPQGHTELFPRAALPEELRLEVDRVLPPTDTEAQRLNTRMDLTQFGTGLRSHSLMCLCLRGPLPSLISHDPLLS